MTPADKSPSATSRLAELRALITDAPMDGPSLIALAVDRCGSQGAVARLSGLAENTVRTYRRGQLPSEAARNAILFAIARTLLA